MDQEPPSRNPGGTSFGDGRRLSVIMFTDMVGYSALSQRDEALALELLEAHRAIVRPVLAAHEGREIKTIGDAFLVEFPSALAATAAAVEIQRALHEHNRAAPGSRKLFIRIGLHAGDVIHRENDVLGDGVNIASRIEPLAEAGGICLSEDIARLVKHRMDLALVRLGAGELKNISTPVDVYRVALPWLKARRTDRIRFLLAKKSVKRSIAAAALIAAVLAGWLLYPKAQPGAISRVAVLPLLNIRPGGGEDYFADGLTEELISTLAAIRDLNVIARTSVAKYRDASAGIKEIGSALNVGSVIEGSVSVDGNQARIHVSLIDVRTESTIWSEEFTSMLRDVFAVQSSIAMKVSSALQVRLVPVEREMLSRPTMASDDAVRAYLLGRTQLSKRTSEAVMQSIESFRHALEQDPNSAYACAGLAEAYTLAGVAGFGTLPREESIALAREYALRAVSLDENLAEAHAALAYVRFRIDWDWAGTEAEYRRALELKPGVAHTHELYALYLAIRKRPEEALVEMQQALQADPLSPSVNNGLGRLLQFQGRFDDAIAQFRKALEIDTQYAETYLSLGISLTTSGRYGEAIDAINKGIQLSGGRPIMSAMLGLVQGLAGRPEETRKILEMMQNQAGAGSIPAYQEAVLHLGMGELDAAMNSFEKAYGERDGTLIYLPVDPIFDRIWAHPRYPDFVRSMGLTP